MGAPSPAAGGNDSAGVAGWFDSVDWPLLKQQKLHLLDVLEQPTLTAEQTDALEGILTLIDAAQDVAVDVLGVPERDVFHLDEDQDLN